jgi:hypothetical protein
MFFLLCLLVELFCQLRMFIFLLFPRWKIINFDLKKHDFNDTYKAILFSKNGPKSTDFEKYPEF